MATQKKSIYINIDDISTSKTPSGMQKINIKEGASVSERAGGDRFIRTGTVRRTGGRGGGVVTDTKAEQEARLAREQARAEEQKRINEQRRQEILSRKITGQVGEAQEVNRQLGYDPFPEGYQTGFKVVTPEEAPKIQQVGGLRRPTLFLDEGDITSLSSTAGIGSSFGRTVFAPSLPGNVQTEAFVKQGQRQIEIQKAINEGYPVESAIGIGKLRADERLGLRSTKLTQQQRGMEVGIGALNVPIGIADFAVNIPGELGFKKVGKEGSGKIEFGGIVGDISKQPKGFGSYLGTGFVGTPLVGAGIANFRALYGAERLAGSGRITSALIAGGEFATSFSPFRIRPQVFSPVKDGGLGDVNLISGRSNIGPNNQKIISYGQSEGGAEIIAVNEIKNVGGKLFEGKGGSAVGFTETYYTSPFKNLETKQVFSASGSLLQGGAGNINPFKNLGEGIIVKSTDKVGFSFGRGLSRTSFARFGATESEFGVLPGNEPGFGFAVSRDITKGLRAFKGRSLTPTGKTKISGIEFDIANPVRDVSPGFTSFGRGTKSGSSPLSSLYGPEVKTTGVGITQLPNLKTPSPLKTPGITGTTTITPGLSYPPIVDIGGTKTSTFAGLGFDVPTTGGKLTVTPPKNVGGGGLITGGLSLGNVGDYKPRDIISPKIGPGLKFGPGVKPVLGIKPIQDVGQNLKPRQTFRGRTITEQITEETLEPRSPFRGGDFFYTPVIPKIPKIPLIGLPGLPFLGGDSGLGLGSKRKANLNIKPSLTGIALFETRGITGNLPSGKGILGVGLQTRYVSRKGKKSLRMAKNKRKK